MINVYFMNVFLVTFCFLSPLLTYEFDKKIAANIYVRLIHSTGCIFHLLPVLYKYPVTIMDPLKITPMPDSVKFIFDRSISYFLWDCIALLIADEEDKGLYILHHLISAFSLSFARYYEYDWYLICIALFLAEITNPITQFSEYLQLIHRENITFEKFYFYSMVFVRGIITPSTRYGCGQFNTNVASPFLFDLIKPEFDSSPYAASGPLISNSLFDKAAQ